MEESSSDSTTNPETYQKQEGESATAKPVFSYKGPVSGLKGLLTSKLAEGLASVVSTIDSTIDSAIDRMTESTQKKSDGGTERIPINSIYPCPDQPRQVFDPKSLEELSMTMKELGQAQAITVRKTEQGYEIISGERRYRAAKLAGFEYLDCVVKDCSLREARLLALVENIQRQDLLPIEEALYLKKVLEENPELSLERLARTLGTHKSTLSEKIQLTEVPEEFQPLLYAKGRSFTHRHWRVLSRIGEGDFLKTMIKNTIDNQLSVAELERSLEAAGIKKALRRKKGSETAAPAAGEETQQLSFQNLGLIVREGPHIRIRAMTIEVKKLPDEARAQIIAELEALIEDLRRRGENDEPRESAAPTAQPLAASSNASIDAI